MKTAKTAAKTAVKTAAKTAPKTRKAVASKAQASHLLKVKLTSKGVSGEYINEGTGEVKPVKGYKSLAALVSKLPAGMGVVKIAVAGAGRTAMLKVTPDSKEFWAEVSRARARKTYVAIQL